MGARATTTPADLKEFEGQPCIRSVVTTATGNCLAMEIAQSTADNILEDPGRSLKLTTASLKYGIKYSGMPARPRPKNYLLHNVREDGLECPALNRSPSLGGIWRIMCPVLAPERLLF
uniref:Uncharacterized protein n=1 Tax=Hyaloperonospora arabidopsidis (strain Emoy2) TaxID=559515 RepID=M4B6G7_HYAAE